MPEPRFVVGIDLGTTNTALAYAELREARAEGRARVRVFGVPQLVAEGEIEARDTLPSFLYLPTAEERRASGLALPWMPSPDAVAGAWAREQGALVPSRLVSSAKSWLCHDAVDRHSGILPWGETDKDAQSRSPVEASAAYLSHLRDAWNHAHASGAAREGSRLELQQISLTVPASFDEEARELTVEAARAAGFERLVLIEEPTAALYAWIAAHRGRLVDHLRDGDCVLICDVGGGTTDFTLVTVAVQGGEPRFERVAVGEHLLLGGDNLDLALAQHVIDRLGRPRLTLRQLQALRRQCATAKEGLLGPPPQERTVVSVLGSGTSIIGGAMRVEVTRDEVMALLLDGFLPRTERGASPVAERRTALREIGLPFATDPAITRHLAAFLRRAGEGLRRPDVVLFNGGFFTPPEPRERVAETLASWFGGPATGWRPRVLANASPATAVAEGAAYYGLVREGVGVRICGGSPRTYYLAVQAGDESSEALQAVCVLARGTEEGGDATPVGREFTVTANRPLAFTLLSSLTRADPLGAVVLVRQGEVHRHAPLLTELRFGKRSRHPDVRVRLEVRFTEVGTLELWLVAPDTAHRWRLQFELRAAGRPDAGQVREPLAPAALVGEQAVEHARQQILRVFGASAATDADGPEGLTSRLEETLGFGKHAWPVAGVRPMADALIEAAAGRNRSPAYEARWLNLLGYCLRPGFGATLDDWRMTQARRVYLAGLTFAHDVQCQAEWLVLWQRVAGGLTPGQQREIFQRHATSLGLSGGKAPKRVPPQVEREGLRLLASLEHLPAAQRTALGAELLARLRRDRRNTTLLWAVGRAGARVPAHGPLNTVVAPAIAGQWAAGLLDLVPVSDDLAATVVQLTARTGDAARDVDEDTRRALYDRLVASGVDGAHLVRLLEILPATDAETARAFGERLPEGLRLVDGRGTAVVD